MQDDGIFVKDLEEIEQLIFEGKYNSALERVDSIYAEEKSSKEEKIKCKILKAQIHLETSSFSKAIRYGEEAFEKSQYLNNTPLMFDSLVPLHLAYFYVGEYEIRKEKVKLISRILDIFENKTSEDYLRRKAKFLTMKRDSFEMSLANLNESIDISEKFGFDQQLADSYSALGMSFFWAGELTKALKINQKCLELSEKLGYFWGICQSVFHMANIQMHRGELDLALNYFLRSLSLFEDINNYHGMACLYIDLGFLYWLRRDLKTSLRYYQKSLSLYKKAKVVGTRHYPWGLLRMNSVLIELGEYDEAFKNLELIELLYLAKGKPIFKKLYFLAKAVLLKTKEDGTSRKEAITLLEEIADDEIIYLELNGLVAFHLCDSYLKEMQKTNDLEVYEKLKYRVKTLNQMAEKQKSYILLAQSLLVQSKLELIEFNVNEARLLLEKAQIIAEEKGITNLAKVISNEYDILLSQLSEWEEMSTYLPSLEERFEFTHIEDLLGKMIRNNVSYIDLIDEQESPSFFLIMNHKGSVLFSESFCDIALNDELLQGILTSIDEFKSSEKLNDDTIKRLKYQNYTIAINSQKDLLLIYTFIGKSYHALQKFRLLIKEFHSFTGEWNIYFEKIKDNQELSLSERMELSKYLEGVFV